MGVIYRGCGHLKQKICWYIFCILSYKLFRAISGLGIFEQMLGQNTKFCPQQIVSDDCPDFFTSIIFCRISCPSWHHIAGFTLESIIFKLRAVSVWKNRIVIFCSKWSPLWRRQISRSGQGVKFHILTELCNLEQPSCYLRHGEATNMGGLGAAANMRGMGNKYGQGQQSDVLNEIFRFAARSTFLFAAYWLPSSHPLLWNHFRPTPSCYTGPKLTLREMFFFYRQVIYEPLREDFYFVRLNKAWMKQLLENIGKNQKGISIT